LPAKLHEKWGVGEIEFSVDVSLQKISPYRRSDQLPAFVTATLQVIHYYWSSFFAPQAFCCYPQNNAVIHWKANIASGWCLGITTNQTLKGCNSPRQALLANLLKRGWAEAPPEDAHRFFSDLDAASAASPTARRAAMNVLEVCRINKTITSQQFII
jgi:hypothetical protein